MPSVAEIQLKLGGRLKGAPETNEALVSAFCQAVGAAPREWRQETDWLGRPDDWPLGCLPRGWRVTCWLPEASEGYGADLRDKETVLSFTGRIAQVSPGQLFRHAKEFAGVAHEILNYPDSGVYWGLKRRLNALNADLAARGTLVERVWFRGLSIHLDDGGDM